MTTRRRRTKGESRARIRLRVIVRRRIRKLCINGSDDGGLALGLVLQHEAYRDGMERSGNSAETVRAVKAHTEMVLRMQGAGMGGKLLEGVLSYIPELQRDIDNYYGYMYGLSQGGSSKDAAEAAYAAYVDGTYDSSKDYWRLTQDGGLVSDGQGWLRDVDGTYINIDGTRTNRPIVGKTLGAKGIETGLLNILYGGTSGRSYDDFSAEQQINSHLIMEDAKIGSYYENENSRGIRKTLWDKTAKNPLDMDYVMTLAGKTIAASVFARYYDSTVDANIAKNES